MAEASSAAAEAGVAVAPLAACFWVLRGDLGAAAFREAATGAGVDLPQTPCTFLASGATTAYWLGPDEWLLAAFGAASDWAPPPIAAGAAVDVSGAYLAWRLSGPRVRSVLRQAISCDVHPRAFPPGRCVGTVFAKATVLLAAHDDDAFELLVRRSYGDYLRRYLAAAGEDYGISFAAGPGGSATPAHDAGAKIGP